MESQPTAENQSSDRARREGADLCVSCLAELDEGCGQCSHCGATVIPYAAVTPWDSHLADRARAIAAVPERSATLRKSVFKEMGLWIYLLAYGLWQAFFIAHTTYEFVWSSCLAVFSAVGLLRSFTRCRVRISRIVRGYREGRHSFFLALRRLLG